MDHPPEPLDRNPDRTLTYGPHPDQVVDVYAGGSAGRVTLIHGGFWKPAYDRAHLAPMAIALADNGFEVALVEYRRPETGRWPVISADVRAALSVLGDEPSVVVGHSAGGHLAVWALHQPAGRALTGAVSLAGCLDLQQADADNLGGGAVRMLLGGPAHDHPDADPARLAPAPKPVVLIHGDRDVDVPIEISRGYRDRVAALDASRTPELIELPGADHWPPITPTAETFGAVVDAIRRLATRR
ncbi:alpha/beta hydrolase [Calidifontibacter indicus]|uniref:Acetyl esterase/lipase n=1 Tax=Calidifontibacter indicus TaxID=419650 RepID=A0A3D9UVC4_9MICO|nr:alpha/beta hydrolase [Calidifontibacter indicus]REF29944.1 acetyl esterase/lipase [Calidifontibacter indicus]